MTPMIWILDEEWKDYEPEEARLKEAFPDCDIRHSGNDFAADLEAFGRAADAILCQVSIPMTDPVMARLKKCRVISVYGAGYNNVDVAAADRRGIRVCNVPGYCAEDVADYVLAAVFEDTKALSAFSARSGNGLWGAQAVTRINRRVSASTLLVVGLGHIGRRTAQRAAALGMRVLAVSGHLSEREAEALGAEGVSLEEGLARADYVSLHVKLTEKTRGLINGAALARMKPDALLINTARGAVVDEAALVEAVSGKTIRGAILDVVAKEPPDLGAPVFHCPGIRVTPHIAYLSRDALAQLQWTCADNAVRVLTGQDTPHRVLP